MSLKKLPLPHFQITTVSSYIESQSDPLAKNYTFGYRVEIKNLGSTQAQLVSRHWIITDAYGHIEEVRGAGVVGLQPKINAGQSFNYESLCPLPTSSGSMKGYYSFLSSTGEPFSVEIPEFYLIAPQAVN